ncbi:FAD protein [Coleophoma cylindrospora]|uniref:FAD protein n=1 Tax=Coleophoma cylindrospora TaxID=1849047 RepID=A0A3D8STQ8_9HELO|nr:FAD protein [Coleophoma cylindrospora]
MDPAAASLESTSTKSALKVIIVGGSVAGLTLAHCFLRQGIDFVVLEAGKEIAPQVGASIVVCPNGARIMDQLGIWDDIFATVSPLRQNYTWTGDGKNVITGDAPDLTAVRTGYPMAFLTRRELLKIISDHLPENANVLTSKRVKKVEQSATGVTAFCEDGSEYSGDILVGADGVHSGIRSIMLDQLESVSPGITKKDANALSAEYNCIFGFGEPVEGAVITGDCHRSYDKNYSTLCFIGEGGKLFWFLFSKLDKRYFGKDIPRYTKDDLDEAIKPFMNIHMTDDITFESIWATRTFANMTCVEESQFENWTSDRIVCVGDAIHKMTPNLGAGGNAAMESAAALANSLSKLSNPSLPEIKRALQAYYEKRHTRANSICDAANQLTRLEALDNPMLKIMALYVIPVLGDFLTDVTCAGITGAELIESLPVPEKSLTATMAWDPESGLGKTEKQWVRALYALPLLAIVYGCHRTMGASMAQTIPELARNIGRFPLGNGEFVAVCTKYFGTAGLDKLLSVIVAFFTPALGNMDSLGHKQAIAFLGDIIPIQTIWMIEGIRRGNFITAAHLLPTLTGVLSQLKGLGFVTPVYFFLHYVQSPLEKYHASDMRMTQVGPAKTIIPTITLSYIVPTVAMLAAKGLSTRQWINGIFWQPFPIYGALIHRLLSATVKDTTKHDRVHNPEADVPYLRYAYGFAAATSALANLYVRVTSPTSLINVFFKDISNPTALIPAVRATARALRYDQIATFSAGALWTMLHFKDLKQKKKLNAGWGRIIGVFAGTTLVAGPGAAMAVMWAWREECLVRSCRPIAGKRSSKA